MKKRYFQLTEYLMFLHNDGIVIAVSPCLRLGDAYLRIGLTKDGLLRRNDIIENICDQFGSNEMIPSDDDIILRLI